MKSTIHTVIGRKKGKRFNSNQPLRHEENTHVSSMFWLCTENINGHLYLVNTYSDIYKGWKAHAGNGVSLSVILQLCV